MKKEKRATKEVLQEIGLRVRAVRVKVGLTQDEFADEVNMARMSISQVENGNVGPSFELLYGMMVRFDVNISYIFTGIGGMFRTDAEAIMLAGEPIVLRSDDKEFLTHYFHSDIVRYEALSKFSMLMRRESALIKNDIEKNWKTE